MLTNAEENFTVKLIKPISGAAMRTLLGQIREISLEEGITKLWVSRVEGLGRKVKIKVEFATTRYASLNGGVMNRLRDKFRGEVGQLGCQGELIVQEIFDYDI